VGVGRADLSGPAPLAGDHYVLGLRFIEPSAEAQAILDNVCGTLPPKEAQASEPGAPRRYRLRPMILRLRRLSLSLHRHCPECGSIEVMKDVTHHYSCRQCGQQFTGFRFGPLRLSF
jgi:ribosomal protein S27AE